MPTFPPRLLLGFVALSFPAAAYETDQLTGRDVPIRDAAGLANLRVNELLMIAAERTNRRTQCEAGDERTRRVLATQINRLFSHSKYVKNRGEFVDGLGFGAYAAWLEESDVDRREFMDRSDIYGELKPTDALVLGSVGVCATIQLAGVLLGTDKTDHFWAQGYEYERESRWGKRPERALKWGTRSERGQYGLLTSNVFSFADLHANWRGYQFYEGLLGRQSVLQQGEDGCVALVGQFQWKDWVDDGMDEVFNPSFFSETVQTAVNSRLAKEKDEVCAAYARWGKDYEARRERVTHEVVNEFTLEAPRYTDMLNLTELCSGD